MLAQRVFKVVADRYMERAADIALFTKTGFSFAEWLNWEAFAACQRIKRWHAKPRPRYHSFNIKCQGFGDLWVEEGDERVLAEIGLVHVHQRTHDGWQSKLNSNMAKLTQSVSRVIPLYIIVLVSRFDIDDTDVWDKRLSKVESWTRPTRLNAIVRLSGGGRMVIRGWEGFNHR